MNKLTWSPSAVTGAIFVTILAGCATSYVGDGQLADHGPFAAKDRYVVDLGPMDMMRTGARQYVLGNLPRERFVIGLEIADLRPNQPGVERSKRDGQVRLLLEGPGHSTVIQENEKLGLWTWSFVQGETKSFLYREGQQSWVRLEGGAMTGTRQDLREDEGWGSFFSPRPNVEYRLTVEVVEPMSRPASARLLVKGGGWK
jgi:hypothetical protein